MIDYKEVIHLTRLAYSRLDDLVNYLLIHNQPVPLKKLVDHFRVSDRTIRNDISLINESIAEHSAFIKLYRSQGYKIELTDKDIFSYFWNSIDAEKIPVSLNSTEERQELLLFLLLAQSKNYSLDELLDTIFVSKNTFYTYLKNIRDLLNPYNIKIVNRPNLGFEVIGNEFSIREAISDLLLKKDLEKYIISYSKIEFTIFQDLDLELLQELELTYLANLNLFESDYYHKNVISILSLSILRIKNGYSLNSIPFKVPVLKDEIIESVNQFINGIEKNFSIIFNQMETSHFLYHLAINFPRLIAPTDTNYYLDDVSDKIVTDFLDKIKYSTNFDWTHDEVLKKDLTAHIKGFVNMELFNADRKNPLLETIKTSFPLAYDLSLANLESIGTKHGMYFSEDEIGYIALHLAGAIERNEQHHGDKLRVVIVCGSGKIMSKIISTKIKKLYTNEITILGEFSYIELINGVLDNIKDIDLIISTVPIKESSKQIFYVDMNNLDDYIKKLSAKFDSLLSYDSNLLRLFSENNFSLISESDYQKEMLLTEMCQNLETNNIVDDTFSTSVLERESIEPTNINQIIAIPHPMSLISLKSAISVAIVPEGVTWNNESSVKLVFLISITKEDYKNTEHIYDLLLSLIEHEDKQRSIIETPTFDNFYQTLLSLL